MVHKRMQGKHSEGPAMEEWMALFDRIALDLTASTFKRSVTQIAPSGLSKLMLLSARSQLAEQPKVCSLQHQGFRSHPDALPKQTLI